MKLKLKLSVIVIAVVAMVITTISVILLKRASTIQLQAVIKSTERLAAEQAKDIQRREELYLQTARSIAQIMGDFESLEPEERRHTYDTTIQAVLEANPNYTGIFTVWKPNAIDGEDGNYAGSGGNTLEGQYASWFSRRAGKIVQGVWEDHEYATKTMTAEEKIGAPEEFMLDETEAWMFNITVPVINAVNNELVGVVGININISGLQPYMENILSSNDEIDVMSVYTGNGTVLASYVPERIGKNLREADAGLYSDYTDEAAQAVQNGQIKHIREYSPVLDKNLQIILYPLHIGNAAETWTVMMGVSENQILADIQQLTLYTIIIAAIFIVIAGLVIFGVAARITRPIVQMSLMLKDISEGEGDLTKSLSVRSKDEIGDMAKYFNSTLDKIRALVVTIRDKANSLCNIGSELSSSMTETAAAVNQITSNIQSIKGQVINQSASVTETNSTMEQVTVNIDKLNGQVENQSESVSRSSSAIEEMLANIASVTQTLIKNAENVQRLTETSEMGQEAVMTVSQDINAIAKESQGLLEINAVMQDIAAQTNLLSMNAAIEAAHAGEAGRGFAVVADEIRKLAESSSKQSKTISGVLKKIKTSIEKVGSSTEAVLEKFAAINTDVQVVSDQSANIKSAMEEQQTGSREILKTIENLNNITRMVRSGSEEMLEGSKEVISESTNLGRVTQEIANGMNEMAAGVTQINMAVNRVNEISIDNRDQISVLVREVERFRVE